jgi:hypothetical protein
MAFDGGILLARKQVKSRYYAFLCVTLIEVTKSGFS